MLRRLDYEKARAMTELEIFNMIDVANLCDAIMSVISDFDGKVLNVRLERALHEATDRRIDVINDQYKFRINVPVSRVNLIFPRDCSTYGDVQYAVNKNITVCNMMYPESVPLINKRLVASNIVKNIESQKQDILDRVENLKSSLDKVHDYKNEFDYLKNRLEELQKELPTEIQEYFDLYWRISQ